MADLQTLVAAQAAEAAVPPFGAVPAGGPRPCAGLRHAASAGDAPPPADREREERESRGEDSEVASPAPTAGGTAVSCAGGGAAGSVASARPRRRRRRSWTSPAPSSPTARPRRRRPPPPPRARPSRPAAAPRAASAGRGARPAGAAVQPEECRPPSTARGRPPCRPCTSRPSGVPTASLRLHGEAERRCRVDRGARGYRALAWFGRSIFRIGARVDGDHGLAASHSARRRRATRCRSRGRRVPGLRRDRDQLRCSRNGDDDSVARLVVVVAGVADRHLLAERGKRALRQRGERLETGHEGNRQQGCPLTDTMTSPVGRGAIARRYHGDDQLRGRSRRPERAPARQRRAWPPPRRQAPARRAVQPAQRFPRGAQTVFVGESPLTVFDRRFEPDHRRPRRSVAGPASTDSTSPSPREYTAVRRVRRLLRRPCTSGGFDELSFAP